jgi:hypothetical protein
VYKNLMDVLMALAREIVENDMKIEDAIVRIDDSKLDLYHIEEDLRVVESSSLINEEEVDALKSLLVYIFMKNSEFEPEDIYAMVFGAGRSILWN